MPFGFEVIPNACILDCPGAAADVHRRGFLLKIDIVNGAIGPQKVGNRMHRRLITIIDALIMIAAVNHTIVFNSVENRIRMPGEKIAGKIAAGLLIKCPKQAALRV